jgi:hypothetical protein
LIGKDVEFASLRELVVLAVDFSFLSALVRKDIKLASLIKLFFSVDFSFLSALVREDVELSSLRELVTCADFSFLSPLVWKDVQLAALLYSIVSLRLYLSRARTTNGE